LNYGSRPPFNKRSKESLIFYEMKIDPFKNKKYFKLKIKISKLHLSTYI
jgi:hypothetical protein